MHILKFVTFIVILLSINNVQVFAQQQTKAKKTKTEKVTGTPLKIIFQFSTGDTLAQKAMMRQLKNALSVEPTAKLEVVCHGPGLDMLHKDKTTVAGKVEEFALKGVVFNACQFTMKEKKYSTQDILPSPGFVEAGIIHIVKMQDKGWHYIKAGF